MLTLCGFLPAITTTRSELALPEKGPSGTTCLGDQTDLAYTAGRSAICSPGRPALQIRRWCPGHQVRF